jgi:hypothetical protein
LTALKSGATILEGGKADETKGGFMDRRNLGGVRASSILGAAIVCGVLFCCTPAGAAGGVPAGTVSCTIMGALTLKTPLTNTASTTAIKVKGVATASSCNNVGVTGGKAPITTAAIKISGHIPAGATCTWLSAPTFGKTKVQVKWQGLNPQSKVMTVSVDNSFLNTAHSNSGTSVTLILVTQPNAKGGFVGQTNTLNLGLDDSPASLATLCSTTGITNLTFGMVNPSTVTSP